jgi:hypothetical protein
MANARNIVSDIGTSPGLAWMAQPGHGKSRGGKAKKSWVDYEEFVRREEEKLEIRN